MSEVKPTNTTNTSGQTVLTWQGNNSALCYFIFRLDEDLGKAMEMMTQLESIYGDLPKLDCGSCGAPTCRALAEDIVKGKAKETDCIHKLKAKIQIVYDQLKNTI